jgi:hypothetical protein
MRRVEVGAQGRDIGGWVGVARGSHGVIMDEIP